MADYIDIDNPGEMVFSDMGSEPAPSFQDDSYDWLSEIPMGDYGYTMDDYSTGMDYMTDYKAMSFSDPGTAFSNPSASNGVDTSGGDAPEGTDIVSRTLGKLEQFGEWASKNKELSTMLAKGISAGIGGYLNSDLRKAQARQAEAYANAATTNSQTNAAELANKVKQQSSGAGVKLPHGLIDAQYTPIQRPQRTASNVLL